MTIPPTGTTPPDSMIWTKMVRTSSGMVRSIVVTREDTIRPRHIDVSANTAMPMTSSANGACTRNEPVGGSGRPSRPIAASTTACTMQMAPSTISFELR